MQQKFPHIAVFAQGFVTEDFFKTLERELPPMVSRAEASRATGGLISAKTLSTTTPFISVHAERYGLVPRSAMHGNRSLPICETN